MNEWSALSETLRKIVIILYMRSFYFLDRKMWKNVLSLKPQWFV